MYRLQIISIITGSTIRSAPQIPRIRIAKQKFTTCPATATMAIFIINRIPICLRLRRHRKQQHPRQNQQKFLHNRPLPPRFSGAKYSLLYFIIPPPPMVLSRDFNAFYKINLKNAGLAALRFFVRDLTGQVLLVFGHGGFAVVGKSLRDFFRGFFKLFGQLRQSQIRLRRRR